MKVRRVSMVALLCMAVMTGHGQAGAPGYAAKWKVVDSLINEKGLTQTALAGVNRIYELPQQEKNEPQQIKALLYARNNFSASDAQSLPLDVYRPLNVLKIYDRLLQVGDVGSNVSRGRRMLRQRAWKNPGSFADPGANKIAFDKEETAKFTPPRVVGEVVQARKDFRETAFFFPDLRTDSAGNVSFSFTMPEAMTSWKWMTLAHTRDLAFGYGEKTVITQKELMVQPNAPRFLREGDRMELPVKVVNLTDSELTGQMSLELTDPTTGETVDGWFTNRQANQYFTVGARQSVVVSFPLDIPYQYNRPVTYKVVAAAGAYSDGEEATLPV